MTQSEAYDILVRAFTVLKPEEVENFRWHLRNETPVFCGKTSSHCYTSYKADCEVDGRGFI